LETDYITRVKQDQLEATMLKGVPLFFEFWTLRRRCISLLVKLFVTVLQ